MVNFMVNHFKQIFNYVEKIMMRLVFISVVLVVLSQVILVNDEVRRYLNFASYLEGTDLEILELSESNNQAVFQGNDSYLDPYLTSKCGERQKLGTITIKLLGYPTLDYAKILINGEVGSVFDQNIQTIKVHDQDFIEIDISEYNFPLSFEIIETSPEILLPRAGTVLKGEREKIILDKVVYDVNSPEN